MDIYRFREDCGEYRKCEKAGISVDVSNTKIKTGH